jgi:hypothetical protein
LWNRYNLVKYENIEGGTLIKMWNNIYTVYKNYIIVIDYTALKGLINEKTKKTLIYSDVIKEMDSKLAELTFGIIFK